MEQFGSKEEIEAILEDLVEMGLVEKSLREDGEAVYRALTHEKMISEEVAYKIIETHNLKKYGRP